MTNLKKAIQTQSIQTKGLKGSKVLSLVAIGAPLVYLYFNQNRGSHQQDLHCQSVLDKTRQFMKNKFKQKNNQNLTQEQWMHYQDYSIYNLRR